MTVSLKEIDDLVKEIFKDSKVLNTENVYEKDDGGYKLVIFFNQIFYKSNVIIYTKLIFFVDEDKVNLRNNEFIYLYDINCIYKKILFNDLNNLKEKIILLFDKAKFGININILSNFIKSPVSLINDWLYKNDIKNISVFNVKYEPKVFIIPCQSLFFTFIININNTNDINLTIKREKNKFVFNFKSNELNENIEKNDLNTLIETIGDFLKNKIK
jgi:hypothetical protein